jgi:polar amino acid transport system substrate-binding protein
MTAIDASVRHELAATGTLRAAINYGNFILATRDRATGESRGVAIDLANEIARRLGVPLAIVAYDLVSVMVEAAPTNAWDIAFLGSDPLREHLISFTSAYLEIEATYLVPAGSPLRSADDVDQPGRRVSAPAKANYELYLRRNLERAELVSAESTDAAITLLKAGKVDALAGLKQALIGLTDTMPGYRMVDGRFMAVQQSIGVPKGRDAALGFLRQVVEDVKRSGLVARAIERTGARGVSVAP